MTVRENDARTRALLAPLAHADLQHAVSAERACLAGLDGSCRTPLACHGVVVGQSLALRAMAFEPDGSNFGKQSTAGRSTRPKSLEGARRKSF